MITGDMKGKSNVAPNRKYGELTGLFSGLKATMMVVATSQTLLKTIDILNNMLLM